MWLKLIQIRMIEMLNLDSRKQESKEEKKRRYVLMIAQGIIFLVIIFISLLSSTSLLVAGQKELVLECSIFCTIVLQFLLTIFRVNGDLYGYKEYDLLASLPIPTRELIISRFGLLYLRNELIAILILYPMDIPYLVVTHANVFTYVRMMLLAIIIPVIPMMLATILDMLITSISYQFKHSQIISKVIRLLLCTLIPITLIVADNKILDISAKLSSQAVSQEMLQESTFDLCKQVMGYFKWIAIYVKAIICDDLLVFLLILAISALLGVGTIGYLSKRYQKLHLKITMHSVANWKRKISFKEKSELLALCEKEIRRFFSSSTCLINLGIGPIFAIIFSFSLLFGDPNKVIRQLDFVGIALGTEVIGDSMMISMTFTIMALVAVCCYSGICVSLEGEAIWILKSLPISTKKIYLAKIIANLVLTLPVSLVCAVVTMTNIQGQLLYNILLFILPICYSIWVATMGLFLNLKYPKLVWNSEVEVVKQSTSSLICMLGEVGVALVLSFTIQLIPEQLKGLAMCLIAVVCLISSGALYAKMCKDAKFAKL